MKTITPIGQKMCGLCKKKEKKSTKYKIMWHSAYLKISLIYGFKVRGFTNLELPKRGREGGIN